jgi:phosphopantetheinyl transferase
VNKGVKYQKVPLIKIINPDKNIFVGIWAITEELYQLEAMANVVLRNESEKISHLAKRKEFLASRQVLDAVCNQLELFDTKIYKSKHGKPFFSKSDWYFSISHTEKYAVCSVCKDGPIGVDTEKIQAKFHVIAEKFLTKDELDICNSDLSKIALRWCIKESAYKWNGEKGLGFKSEIIINETLTKVLVKGAEKTILFQNIDELHFWAIVF